MSSSKAVCHQPYAQQRDRRKNLGIYGETLAQSYLEAEGYILEAKNWIGQRGELDLIMRKNTILVIVEVRTTSTAWLERPAEATPLSKQKQVARCADEYLVKRNPQTMPTIDHIRFDIIGLFLPQSFLNKTSISHLLTEQKTQNQKQTSQSSLQQNTEIPSEIHIDHVENAYTSPWAF